MLTILSMSNFWDWSTYFEAVRKYTHPTIFITAKYGIEREGGTYCRRSAFARNCGRPNIPHTNNKTGMAAHPAVSSFSGEFLLVEDAITIPNKGNSSKEVGEKEEASL